jgi:hypothetical protein
MTESQDERSAAAAPGPELIMRGGFSLFREPDGGMHLSYRPAGADADTHMRIPAAMVAMGQQMTEGMSPVALARQLLTLRRSTRA